MHAPGWFPCFDAAVACARLVSLVLFLALCSRRWYWQWYVLAGFAGYDTPRAVFPSVVNAVAIPQVQFLVKVMCRCYLV